MESHYGLQRPFKALQRLRERGVVRCFLTTKENFSCLGQNIFNSNISISIYADQMKCCSRSKARLTTGDESIRSYNKNFRVEYLCEVILELRSASSKELTVVQSTIRISRRLFCCIFEGIWMYVHLLLIVYINGCTKCVR